MTTPLTPEEERELREAWGRFHSNWSGRRLLATLDAARKERDQFERWGAAWERDCARYEREAKAARYHLTSMGFMQKQRPNTTEYVAARAANEEAERAATD